MKHYLLIAVFIILPLFVRGQEAIEGDDGDLIYWIEYSHGLFWYHQPEYKLVDPKGDALLIRLGDAAPSILMSFLFNGSLPQAKPELTYTIGTTPPIDYERLLNKCAEIMRGEFPDIFPTIGPEHEWSPQAKEYMKHGFWHRLDRYLSGKQQHFPLLAPLQSKLFLCLACGLTNFFCATGKEKALKERILSYPDHSVQIHDVFAESYILNGGDLYLTLLTCENVLASYPHRQERKQDPLQDKLVYIRHDSEQSGDNYGAWYHFFGIALYGMLRPECVSLFVADAESFGSFFYEGSDRQEALINRLGARFGAELRKMLEDGSWWLQTRAGNRTDYMLPNHLSLGASEPPLTLKKP